MIRTSKYYVYFENQFFITTTNSYRDGKVKNTIGDEIVDRIVKAHRFSNLILSSHILWYSYFLN